MCCLICYVCMKKEFDISCSIYQAEGEIRHRRRENQMAKVMAKKTVTEKNRLSKDLQWELWYVLRQESKVRKGIDPDTGIAENLKMENGHPGPIEF